MREVVVPGLGVVVVDPGLSRVVEIPTTCHFCRSLAFGGHILYFVRRLLCDLNNLQLVLE